MIIVKAIGGLGNQLFQYALGKHLSIRNDVSFKLDVSNFETYSLHEYSLGYFDIDAPEASGPEVEEYFPRHPFFARLARVRNQLRPRTARKVFRERDRRFDADVFKVGTSVYLDGYWQSERYFSPIEDQLRRDLIVKEPMGLGDERIANEIERASVSIGVHFRLANYATGATNTHHGLCSPDYYVRALEYLLKRFTEASLFVFSDDIDWVRANGHLDRFRTTYVDHNQGFDGQNYVNDKNYQDLRLLSLCDHQIIANSTFSWWAAWLNLNPTKQVVAPRQWFADGSPCEDIVPESWVRL